MADMNDFYSGANDSGSGMTVTPDPGPAPILSGQPSLPATSALGGNPQPAPVSGATGPEDLITNAPGGNPNLGPEDVITNQPISRPAGVESVWKNIAIGALQGALTGGAAGAGAKNFGQGVARGAQAVQQQQQRQFENAVTQKQLQFESIKAADSVIAAKQRAEQASREATRFQWEQADHNQNVEDYMKANGVTPKATVSGTKPSETQNAATGTLTTLAQGNGGTIPQVTTFDTPHTKDDPTHSTSVYSWSKDDIQKNPNAARKFIDNQRVAMGLLPSTDDDWKSGFGKTDPNNNVPSKGSLLLAQQAQGQRDAAQSAIAFLQVPLVATGAKSQAENDAANQATLTNLQQNVANYKNSATPDPQYLNLLQTKADTFEKNIEHTRSNVANAANATTLQQGPAKATAAQEEDIAKQNTPQGRANLQKTQQDIIDAKYKNADAHQKALFESGQDPQTGEKLNLANAPDEMLLDGSTHQPIPTKMLSTLKPTQQETNRADFAVSALHSLDRIDQLKAQGKLPNGPISGWTTKGLIKAGLSKEDAAEAYGLIALTQSAATGAHVGGRFSSEIMQKMNGLLTLNANDSQFEGQEKALRDVMEPYAQRGGRETVGQYKQSIIGQTKVLNGQPVKVTGFNKDGSLQLTPVTGQ